MRTALLTLLVLAGPAQADISFRLYESFSGKPELVRKPKTFHQKFYLQATKSAIYEDDFVSITDSNTEEMTIIDHQQRTRARVQFHAARKMHRDDIEALPKGLRLRVIETGVPDEWNGLAVQRTVTKIHMPAQVTGLPTDAEATVTEWTSSSLPGWNGAKTLLKPREERYQTELNALVSTMAVKDLDYHRDVLAARDKIDTLALPVRTVKEVCLAKGECLMRIEKQVLELSAEPLDEQLFRVPPEYTEIDFNQMVLTKTVRTGHP